jgi:DNA-binding NarL/FixJ family response regulator
MMRVLLIEDAEDKRAQLLAFLHKQLPAAMIIEERSLQSGLRRMLTDGADVIVLDMSMPTFDITPLESGGLHKHFAGRELLQQLQRRALRTWVIVVTQFDTFGTAPHERTLEMLDQELRSAHAENYLGAVYYHATQDLWKTALADLLEIAGQRISEKR